MEIWFSCVGCELEKRFSTVKMKTKREEWENTVPEEEGVKRQKLDEQSSPQLAFDNPLLPLASYDDDDEDDIVDRRAGGRDRVISNSGRVGQNGYAYDEEDSDDDEYQSAIGGQGLRNRMVEVRRDCPYLDTVNRQVLKSIYLLPL